ncbi:hypothetical protein Plav_3062 [Parvibaculum lavamentivorans DS-1]|uniref:Uncharacterized protein n=1 Tax=Parvibaculum lavamentivorans (strain DS-1 / DSM 13023 / NCIMB 13966) TaxID=402881 RepID=A7HXN6_PARL1|nr:hypothetical protein [Parvibaculum lavamentivorans]ABS64669.1 hypothetical protein Plav_3062 [Parvibaculum lavamentivorans DS-1]
MTVAELLGNMSMETQISVGGLILLFVILTALHMNSLRNQREQEAARSEREIKARIDALMRKLEGKSLGRGGRITSAVVSARPVRRTAEKLVPASRCPAPAKRASRR